MCQKIITSYNLTNAAKKLSNGKTILLFSQIELHTHWGRSIHSDEKRQAHPEWIWKKLPKNDANARIFCVVCRKIVGWNAGEMLAPNTILAVNKLVKLLNRLKPFSMEFTATDSARQNKRFDCVVRHTLYIVWRTFACVSGTCSTKSFCNVIFLQTRTEQIISAGVIASHDDYLKAI